MSTGEQLKLIGLARARKKHSAALAAAQAWARFLARNGESITIEDVKKQLALRGVSELENAAGCVFKGEEWECAGWVTAKRPTSHSRAIRVWRLKPHYTERNRLL